MLVESCVYIIKNKINYKIYIGSTKTFRKRKYKHKKNLNSNTHKNKRLQEEWNKFGEINFEFSILEIIENVDELINREQYWIDLLEPFKKDIGYNQSAIAKFGCYGKRTVETVQKMNDNRKPRLESRFTKEEIIEIKREIIKHEVPEYKIAEKYNISFAQIRRLKKQMI